MNSLSKQLHDVALGCREIFLEGFHANKSVSFKGTVDLVTEYDVAIEKILTQRLEVLFGEFTIVGEESTKEISYPHKAIYIPNNSPNNSIRFK